MDVREPFGLWIFRPDSLRAAEIWNARFRGNAGARQGDDARGRRYPAPHEVDLARHFVSLYSTHEPDFLPTHWTAGNDGMRDLMLVIPTAVSTREPCALGKLRVR